MRQGTMHTSSPTFTAPFFVGEGHHSSQNCNPPTPVIARVHSTRGNPLRKCVTGRCGHRPLHAPPPLFRRGVASPLRKSQANCILRQDQGPALHAYFRDAVGRGLAPAGNLISVPPSRKSLWARNAENRGVSFDTPFASFRAKRSGVEESSLYRHCYAPLCCEDPSTTQPKVAPLRMTQEGKQYKNRGVFCNTPRWGLEPKFCLYAAD